MKLNVLLTAATTFSVALNIFAIPTPQFKHAQAPKKQHVTFPATTHAASPATAQPATHQSAPTNPQVLASIPYMTELQKSGLPASEQQAATQTWQALYNLCLAANNGTLNLATPATGSAQNAKISTPAATLAQQADVRTVLSTNFLAKLKNYLNPQNFPAIPNDPQNLQRNYATVHLQSAVSRLDSIFKLENSPTGPTVNFTGDNRDLGIIVNIQNNTDLTFSISQNSLDGKTSTPIGVINPGLNGVNLHTAALQTPAAKSGASSTHEFVMTTTSGNSPSIISIRMMSGKELQTYLKSISKDPNSNIVTMNGNPISLQNTSRPNDFYLVLQNIPKQETIGQRIQVLDVSLLGGNYLINLQINQDSIIVDKKQKTILQPSIFNVQMLNSDKIKNQKNNAQEIVLAIPLFILPEFLWNASIMQSYWMLIMTDYLLAATNYKFLNKDALGNDFAYFENLGCFNENKVCRAAINLFGTCEGDLTLADAPWIIETALFETDPITCMDIPQLFLYQDEQGNMVANQNDGLYINIQVSFVSEKSIINNQNLFLIHGFNNSYNLSHLHTLLFPLKTDLVKKSIFLKITRQNPKMYSLVFTDKHNKIISQQKLNVPNQAYKLSFEFLSNYKNWIGSIIPKALLLKELKIMYKFTENNSMHHLFIDQATSVDKIQTIHEVFFSVYPLTDLYFDVYQTLNILPFTRCFVIKNNIMPSFLNTFDQEDWELGLYLIPSIKNNKNITSTNPGFLTVDFYKSDKKTKLGSITTKGQVNNTSTIGIPEPVKLYNLGSESMNTQLNISLSTAIFLRLHKAEQKL